MPNRPKKVPGLRSHFNQAVARRPSGGGIEAGQPAQVPPPLPAQVPSPSGSRSVNSRDRPKPGGACALLPAPLGVTHARALGLSLRPTPWRTALAPSPRLRPHGGLLQRPVLHLANTVELAQACRPTSRVPVAAAVVMMGRRGPGHWAGCEEAAVARDLLPEDGRKWLRRLAGGGEEREGRAGPQGVEGVGPAGGWDPARPGSGAGRAEAPSRDRMGGVQVRSPCAEGPSRRRGGSKGSQCWEGLVSLCRGNAERPARGSEGKSGRS